MCMADLLQFDALNGVIRPLCPRLSGRARFLSAAEVCKRMAKRRFYAYGGMAIIQRKTLLELGAFKPELKWYADWFCVFVIAFRYGTCYIPEPLAAMRILPDSYSASGRKQSAVQRTTLGAVIRLLKSEEFRDVLTPIQQSGALCVLGSRVLGTLLKEQHYWDLISCRLLAKMLVNIPLTILGLNPATPSPLAWLDQIVRRTIANKGSIQQYGIQLENGSTLKGKSFNAAPAR